MLIEISLIWVAYAVAVAILVVFAAVFVYIYQKPRERSIGVTVVCIVTVSALLATILLLPVDVALVSATVKRKEGVRKDWATQDKVDSIVFTLQTIYYTLYALDTVLCLIVVPFTYFLYEEYDDAEAEEGSQTLGSRLWGAFKYTIAFIVIVIILFLVGFFLPVAAKNKDRERHDLDYFKNLLEENRGERALTFALGLLMAIGTIIYVLYTGAGLALLPVTFIKSAPSISAPHLAATVSSELERNRERQSQLEARNEGRQEGFNQQDRNELAALIKEERMLTRRQRLAAEERGEGKNALIRGWIKLEAVFRPIKLIGGLFMMFVAVLVWTSMLITGIDKARNSLCKARCGYLLGHVKIFQPVNWIFLESSKVFPVDYVIFLLLLVFMFSSSVVGIAAIGIRFLWLTIFKIQKGRTSPQALLLATVLLALIVLAINYSMAMMIAPQYATFGPQTYCDRPRHLGDMPDCSTAKNSIRHCTERARNHAAQDICTPSVASTFINRANINFPILGVVDFWAQFAFLAVYMSMLVAALVKTPKLETDLDEDLEEDEEEGLLASTGRRFNATWQDITGRARKNNPVDYGSTSEDQGG